MSRAESTNESTNKDLEDWFRDRGLQEGEEIQQATGFLLEAADYAGLELGPGPAESESGASGLERPPKTRAMSPQPPVDGSNDHSISFLHAKRAAYVDLLMQLVRATNRPDDRLLDRLERVLGYPADEEEHSRT